MKTKTTYTLIVAIAMMMAPALQANDTDDFNRRQREQLEEWSRQRDAENQRRQEESRRQREQQQAEWERQREDNARQAEDSNYYRRDRRW